MRIFCPGNVGNGYGRWFWVCEGMRCRVGVGAGGFWLRDDWGSVCMDALGLSGDDFV